MQARGEDSGKIRAPILSPTIYDEINRANLFNFLQGSNNLTDDTRTPLERPIANVRSKFRAVVNASLLITVRSVIVTINHRIDYTVIVIVDRITFCPTLRVKNPRDTLRIS